MKSTEDKIAELQERIRELKIKISSLEDQLSDYLCDLRKLQNDKET